MGAVHPQNICNRALNYALRAVDLFDHLQQSDRRAAWIIGSQYFRAASSIGANLEEAQGGESRSDFVHKCAVALKEAREALFWLRLLEREKIVPASRLGSIIQETNEIVSILTTIVVKTKRGLPRMVSLFSILYSLFL